MFTLSRLVLFIALIFLLVFLLFVLKRRRRGHLRRSLDMSLFLIRLPRYEVYEKEKKNEEKLMISKMEQIYSNFLYLDRGEGFFKRFFSGLPRVVFEIASQVGEGDISFYIVVPSNYENALNKYVQGVYSGAILEKIKDDYTIFEPGGDVSASYLRLKETFFFPVNTYQTLERDPLEAVINSLSDITPDEGAAFQVVIRPMSFNLREKGEEMLSQITKEKKGLAEAIAYVNADPISKFLRGFSRDSGKKLEKGQPPKTEEKKVDDTVVEAIRAKIKKPGFEVNIRLVGVARQKERSQEILHNLESSFSQFSSGFNSFKPIKIKRRRKRKLKKFIYDFSFRNFDKKKINILNGEELSSIFHLPLSHIESPYIKWVKTKESPPPAELPKTGLVLIGKAAFRGEDRDIYIPSREDRRRHLYIIGQTGTGKTSLLKEMIRQDIEKGEGVGVIDPHGDLVEHILTNVPQERIKDVILFEPFETARPFGLNMLEWDT
ncbi:MAG: DUF87 domain-containing protein, partial [Candidatus Nealsonbacteria bacterium]|nr:DUF87 domain-containing protein [Candidatus Nealsonbacteria bacterium]